MLACSVVVVIYSWSYKAVIIRLYFFTLYILFLCIFCIFSIWANENILSLFFLFLLLFPHLPQPHPLLILLFSTLVLLEHTHLYAKPRAISVIWTTALTQSAEILYSSDMFWEYLYKSRWGMYFLDTGLSVSAKSQSLQSAEHLLQVASIT